MPLVAFRGRLLCVKYLDAETFARTYLCGSFVSFYFLLTFIYLVLTFMKLSELMLTSH